VALNVSERIKGEVRDLILHQGKTRWVDVVKRIVAIILAAISNKYFPFLQT